MPEVMLKTHLIVTDMHDEYKVKWTGKMKDAKPFIKNGLPVFILVGSEGRLELNTIDIDYIEKCAKNLSHPRGKQAITSDSVYIYLLEENENEKLMGVLLHDHVKQYQQMYDRFEYY